MYPILHVLINILNLFREFYALSKVDTIQLIITTYNLTWVLFQGLSFLEARWPDRNLLLCMFICNGDPPKQWTCNQTDGHLVIITEPPPCPPSQKWFHSFTKGLRWVLGICIVWEWCGSNIYKFLITSWPSLWWITSNTLKKPQAINKNQAISLFISKATLEALI